MHRFCLFSLLFLASASVALAQGSMADASAGGAGGFGGAALQGTPADGSEPEAESQQEAGPETLHYVVAKSATLFRDPAMKQAYAELSRRDPVFVVRKENSRFLVRTKDGAQGYLRSSEVSNVWIRVVKSTRTLYLFRGTELVREIPVDLGYNTFADKERRGGNQNKDDWRTPEGAFFVVGKNPRSQFYKAFVLNYPTIQHARRGLEAKIISEGDYARIVKAENASEMPPMNTPLGGMIEIHGNGTSARTNWTQGCVAVTDQVMDDLWNIVEVGTPVLVED